jgi:4-amino-4-deoxy-L-arabinose transferase-like glycosyltransferase
MLSLPFEKVTITHILLMSLVVHAFVISQPQDWLVFDESLFSWASRTLLDGEDRTPYQMPGIHIIGAIVISIFGDNWFSLRTPVVIFGILTLLVFYAISIRFTSKQNALLATTILSFDTIFFFHSQLFLRDIPMMFFGMISFYFYLKKKYYLAAFCLGFGALIKETIIFFLVMIAIYHITRKFHNTRQNIPSGILSIKETKSKFDAIKISAIFLLIVASSFLIPLWIYDIIITPIEYEPAIPIRYNADGTENAIPYPLILVYESRGYIVQNQTGVITNPIDHLELYFTKGLLAGAYDAKKRIVTHNYLPYNWVLPIPPAGVESGRGGIGMGFKKAEPFDDVRAGWPHKGEVLGVERLGYQNVALWPVAFWGSIAFVAYSIIKKTDRKNGFFIGVAVLSMFVPYLLIHIFNGRVMLPYYFILTVPFISLGIVLLFDKITNNKVRFFVKLALLSGVVAWFVWFFPVKIFGDVSGL